MVGSNEGGGVGEDEDVRGRFEGRVCFEGSHAAADLLWLSGDKQGGKGGTKRRKSARRAEEGEEDEEERGWLEELLGIDASQPLGGNNVLWAVAGLVLTAGLMYLRCV